MKLDSYNVILSKLRSFSQRYYLRMLLRGVVMFTALGCLIMLGVLWVEYLLWLSPNGRLTLLVLLLLVEGYMLYRYIIIPLSYLFRLKRGIDNKQASLIIGQHFPEVGDRLYNLLDLAEDPKRSELLVASMEQRSRGLFPVAFYKAISYKDTIKYLKYLALPFAILGIIWISGIGTDFFGSYTRVVNYDLAYQPPAPFTFKVFMGDLEAVESKPFPVEVTTEGSVRPDNVFIVIDGDEYMLQEVNGMYRYTFKPPLSATRFYFRAYGVSSEEYTLRSFKTPAIEDFSMQLAYPTYLNKPTETVRGTGNAVIPEGTRVTWTLQGRNADSIHLRTSDTSFYLDKRGGSFTREMQILEDFSYQLETSNEFVKRYEVLSYRFAVVRDAMPRIQVKQVIDSLSPGQVYFIGEASDDYGIHTIRLVYYPEEDEQDLKKVELLESSGTLEPFYYTFPTGLQIEEGTTYMIYFEVTDNDALRNGKTVRSRVFRIGVPDELERNEERLEFHQGVIGKMGRALEEYKEEKEALRELNRLQKEQQEVRFSDQKAIRNFVERQRSQEEMMEKFSRNLKENLERDEHSNPKDELLKERLERAEMEAQKNARLLEELKEIAEKINKEELSKRLEELGKQRMKSERNLEQIVELTKRYYVTEKLAQLSRELLRISERQMEAGRKTPDISPDIEEQRALNQEFEKRINDLEELKRDNLELKKPVQIPVGKEEQQAVVKEQEEILERLNRETEPSSMEGDKQGDRMKGIGQQQKAAGEKIKKIGEKLEQATSSGGQGDATIAEDAEMLRQILDNLISFSFKQERLFERIGKEGGEITNFSEQIRDQQELRELFGHVDDSLFALSLRRAEISELVNEQIAEVYYNIDKALENMAEDRIYQGVSNQQYVFTAANTLADFLAALLDNMQQSLSMGSGQSTGQAGFQLPDIIQSQSDLKERMNGSGTSGEQQGEQNGRTNGQKQGQGQGQNSQTEEAGGKQGTGSGEGEGDGRKGSGQEGSGTGSDEGDGIGEAELKELYEIYKQQQQIRTALEEQLQDMILQKDKELAQKIARQMEDFENELLENGITERTVDRMNRIEHELLKLENAVLQQGEKNTREGQTNTRQFQNPVLTRPRALENYGREIEILDRQALPLHQIFRNKVKDYFREDD